jgi:hypothetical protein
MTLACSWDACGRWTAGLLQRAISTVLCRCTALLLGSICNHPRNTHTSSPVARRTLCATVVLCVSAHICSSDDTSTRTRIITPPDNRSPFNHSPHTSQPTPHSTPTHPPTHPPLASPPATLSSPTATACVRSWRPSRRGNRSTDCASCARWNCPTQSATLCVSCCAGQRICSRKRRGRDRGSKGQKNGQAQAQAQVGRSNELTRASAQIGARAQA